MTRTLRGAWSRRSTLAPLLLLTIVVIAATVMVSAFAVAAGTSQLLSLPLLLVGLVAIPGATRELSSARRGEIALARVRGLRAGSLLRLLLLEPMVVLGLGGVVGVLLGLLAARVAVAVWAGPGASFGWVGLATGLVTGLVVAVVAVVVVLLGSLTSAREPLSEAVRVIGRPGAASVASNAVSVLVVVAAVVAVYRSRVSSGAPDWVVLLGPALVGLASGQVVAWLLRLGARVLVPLTAGRGLGGFLASRRVARVADAVGSMRVLVAAAVVAGLALTGAQQVRSWTDDTARLAAGAPLQVPLGTDAGRAVDLTHQLDPDGQWLMAAVLVPGEGAAPNRRAFLDTARYDRVVGDFYAGTPAASVGSQVDRLGSESAGRSSGLSRSQSSGSSTGLAFGHIVTATVQSASGAFNGSLRPQVDVAYRDDAGTPTQVQVPLTVPSDGSAVVVATALPGCGGGCLVTTLTLSQHRRDARVPWLVTSLDVGGLDALALDLQQDTASPGSAPVLTARGLLSTVGPRRSRSGSITVDLDASRGVLPILATDSAHWPGGAPVLNSPGGEDRSATVVQRDAALPLVQGDGLLADLPRSLVGAPPTVPAAQVMVLARADTPARMLADLRPSQAGPVRTLADIRDRTFRQAHAAQSVMYGLMAGCCLLVALLVLTTAVGRQRRSWLRDLAALRVVGVDRDRLRAAGRAEVAGLVLLTLIGTAVGGVLAVRLLLGHLPLVDVPAHAVPLPTGLMLAPIALVVVTASAIVLVVAGRGRRTSPDATRPAILRQEA